MNKNVRQYEKDFYGRMKYRAMYYVNHLEELKKDIQCPQLGYATYGKLGALDKNGTFIINELIKKIERQDETIRQLYEENQKITKRTNQKD
jgi:hypothetical protein